MIALLTKARMELATAAAPQGNSAQLRHLPVHTSLVVRRNGLTFRPSIEQLAIGAIARRVLFGFQLSKTSEEAR